MGDLRGVMYFAVSDEVCVQRVLERAEKATEKRTDDTADGIKARLETNKKECEPIVKKFEDMGKLVKIDAEPKPNEVWKTVQKTIRDFEASIRTDYPPPPRPEGEEEKKGKGKRNKSKKGKEPASKDGE